MKGRGQVTRGQVVRLDLGPARPRTGSTARAGQPSEVRRLARWKYDQATTVAIKSKAPRQTPRLLGLREGGQVPLVLVEQQVPEQEAGNSEKRRPDDPVPAGDRRVVHAIDRRPILGVEVLGWRSGSGRRPHI